MGVPRLAPYIYSNFAEAIQHFQQGELIFFCENVYIDAPSLLHAAAQLVNNYGQNKRNVDPYVSWSPIEKRAQVYKVFFESIVQISEIVVPTKTLYIAIDGPAPLAKMAQQRQRRFVAAMTRGSSDDGSVFDSNSMTPGTVFMLELTKYMHTAIRKKINSTASWKNLNVIFSSPLIPGEAEHKLLDYIRALPKYVAENETHTIFGPDGDLIMLSLAAHLPKMYLFKDDQFSVGYYYLLNMGMVREQLPKVLGQNPQNRHVNETTDDFILAGFFVGNDFLPKIQMFMFLEDGLELMLATASKLGQANPRLYLTVQGEISHGGFTRFIEQLAHREISYIADQARIPPLDPRFKNETLLKHMSGGKLNMGAYRVDYYKKAGVDATDEAQVKRICLDYLRTITWVFEYYVHGLPSWKEYYPRHYAPLMGDLAQTMNNLTVEELDILYTFEKDQPPLPFVQLLSVLPPPSAHLLPKPFHTLFTNPESPLVKAGFYPDKFEIDYEGKTKEHMGVALLPFVDVDVVVNAYTPIADTLQNTYVRNSVKHPEMFRYEAGYLASYTSDYGNIPKLQVKKYIL